MTAETEATVEIYYQRLDGITETAEGIITVAHPTASYGLPVLCIQYPSFRPERATLRAGLYGPADLPAHTHLRYMRGDMDVYRRAAVAGYRTDRYDWTDGIA